MPGFLISKSHIRFARFNKRETFKDNEWLSGLPLWELTANFGFQRLQDGRCQVYHHGEIFAGPFPVHLIWLFHSYVVAQLTERHINGRVFAAEGKEEEEAAERKNMLFAVAKQALGFGGDAGAEKADPRPKLGGILQKLKALSSRSTSAEASASAWRSAIAVAAETAVEASCAADSPSASKWQSRLQSDGSYVHERQPTTEW